MSQFPQPRFVNRMPLAMVAMAALLLTGCGGGGSGTSTSTAAAASASVSPSMSVPPAPSPSASTAAPSAPLSATSDDPQKVAESLKAQIAKIGKVVKITEDSDANDLIGRPGQYDAATFMQDTRLPCTAKDNYDELSIDCGAKVERWASTKDAKARAADIRQKLKAYGLGAEYDYVRDGLVLRVSGDIKPSQAKKYEAAFAGEKAM
jgi:hypothetical protein